VAKGSEDPFAIAHLDRKPVQPDLKPALIIFFYIYLDRKPVRRDRKPASIINSARPYPL
jgi:hypothetical protein